MKYAFVFCFALLTACGQDSNTRTITLLTPLGSGSSHSPNLADILRLPAPVAGSTCAQGQLYAGYKIGSEPDINIQRYPIQMRMDAATTWVNTPDAISLLQNATLDAPITFNIPKGQDITVGIIGTIYQPGNADANGHCPENPALDTNAGTTQSLAGHKSLGAGFTGNSVSLGVFVVPTVASALTGCVDSNSADDQNCATGNFVQVTASAGTIFPSSTVTVEYLLGNGPAPHVVHYLDGNSITTVNFRTYLPDIFPIVFHYQDYSGVHHDDTFVKNGDTVTGPAGSAFTVTKL